MMQVEFCGVSPQLLNEKTSFVLFLGAAQLLFLSHFFFFVSHVRHGVEDRGTSGRKGKGRCGIGVKKRG